MYALEALFSGLFSLTMGLGAGVVFSKLFQMLLLRISEISVDIKFSFFPEADPGDSSGFHDDLDLWW